MGTNIFVSQTLTPLYLIEDVIPLLIHISKVDVETKLIQLPPSIISLQDLPPHLI